MLQRRRRNSGRQNDGKRFPRHLQHVRGYECAIRGRRDHVCVGKVQAMHVDYAPGKGLSMKVPDVYTIPGCAEAHREQTETSWPRWEAKYGIDALALAKELARKSPSIIRAAREAGHSIELEAEEA